ncbi:MAG: ATP-binding protein [bacterium]
MTTCNPSANLKKTMHHTNNNSTAKFRRLPKQFIWAIVAISVLPSLLNLFGVDFSSQGSPFPWDKAASMADDTRLNAMFSHLSGAFSHTILEWSAFCTAIFTVILAFLYFSIKRDIVTPIIALALLWAGCMDAFHTFAADRLIDATAPNRNLIPFTWAICRAFNACIFLCGVSLLLVHRRSEKRGPARLVFVSTAGVSFGAAAYAIIAYCATNESLPQTMFSDAFITRPYDVVALMLFIILGTIAIPVLNKKHSNLFMQSVWISMIPNIATQMHMAFGSTALFDSHFNIAHLLKVVAYLVPFAGLVYSNLQTFKAAKGAKERLIETQVELTKTNQDLAMEINERKKAQKQLEYYVAQLRISNQELDDFAYIASHDLKEPLRGMTNYAGFLIDDYQDKLDDEGRSKLETLQRLANRMEILIDSLLFYSRLGRTGLSYERADLSEILREVLDSLRITLEEKGVEVRVPMSLPTIQCDRVRMAEVYRNLISNAIKYNDKSEKWIEIGFRETQGLDGQQGDKATGRPIVYYVRDNGIGIRENHRDKIFTIFKRLHTQDKYGGGTGAGLTIVKKIVEQHGGRIWVESTTGEGTTFYFTLAGDRLDNEVTVVSESEVGLSTRPISQYQERTS